MDYKLAFYKLKVRYPKIAEEITKDSPHLDNLKMLDVFLTFCRVQGVTVEEMSNNKNSAARNLFLAVFVRVFDPDYFQFDKPLRRGLRSKAAILTGCGETHISHILSTVKAHLRIYKSFRKEVEYIYEKVKKLVDEKERGQVDAKAGNVLL